MPPYGDTEDLNININMRVVNRRIGIPGLGGRLTQAGVMLMVNNRSSKVETPEGPERRVTDQNCLLEFRLTSETHSDFEHVGYDCTETN